MSCVVKTYSSVGIREVTRVTLPWRRFAELLKLNKYGTPNSLLPASFINQHKDMTDNCSAEIRIRIASAMAAMARIDRIWRCNTTSFASKFNFYKSCHLHPPLWLWNIDSASWLWKNKCPGLRDQEVPEETSLRLLLGAQDQRLGAERDQLYCGSTGTSSGTVKRRKLAWLGHVTPAAITSPKPSFRAHWSVDDAVVGRENAGWTAHARTARKDLLQKRLAEDLCWIVPHVPFDDPVGQGTELKWTDYY